MALIVHTKTTTINGMEAAWPVKAEVYITHGEVVASDVMRKRIRDRFGWDVEVSEVFDEV